MSRQRKLKHEAERYDAVKEFSVADPKAMKGRWGEMFPGKDLYLEMGCGRGQFLAKQALLHPENAYIGTECRLSVALRAMELIRAGGNDEVHRNLLPGERREDFEALVPAKEPLSNATVIAELIGDPRDYFADGELSGVYANFSDPWPKSRHEKRRMTSKSYLEAYRAITRPGGFLEIKTDNDDLFRFTLEMINELHEGVETRRTDTVRMPGEPAEEGEADGRSYVIEELSYDLHRSNYAAKDVTTQYEEKFMAKGVPIKYVRVRF
jgi:tRNA (guanine-N7-)-methyltransferase